MSSFSLACIENNFRLTVDILLESKAFESTKTPAELQSFSFVSGGFLQLTSRQPWLISYQREGVLSDLGEFLTLPHVHAKCVTVHLCKKVWKCVYVCAFGKNIFLWLSWLGLNHKKEGFWEVCMIYFYSCWMSSSMRSLFLWQPYCKSLPHVLAQSW